jgi:hypothetical protein
MSDTKAELARDEFIEKVAGDRQWVNQADLDEMGDSDDPEWVFDLRTRLDEEEHELVEPGEGNLVSSFVREDRVDRGYGRRLFGNHELIAMHKPVLDLDIPATLMPSTTEGHYHLYLDVEIPEKDYRNLLGSLASVGIIQQGFKAQMTRRGATFVRPPWVKKPGKEAANTDGTDMRGPNHKDVG